MNYYLVTIGISKDKNRNEWEHHHWICADLKTAIKCANHKAYVYDFNSLNNKWEGTSDITQYYDKGWISIEKKTNVGKAMGLTRKGVFHNTPFLKNFSKNALTGVF